MSDCPQCGCHIPDGEGKKRRMKIGASRSQFAADWRFFYAEQILCDLCARRFDFKRNIAATFLFIGMFLVYVWIS